MGMGPGTSLGYTIGQISPRRMSRPCQRELLAPSREVSQTSRLLLPWPTFVKNMQVLHDIRVVVKSG